MMPLYPMQKIESDRFRQFVTYSELDAALNAVLQTQLAEARFKKANRNVWRDIGWVQHIAIADVLAVVAVIPRDIEVRLWQQTFYQKLLTLIERFKQTPPEVDDSYRHIDAEQMSHYIPTVIAFACVITDA